MEGPTTKVEPETNNHQQEDNESRPDHKCLNMNAVLMGKEYNFLIDTGATHSILYLKDINGGELQPWHEGPLQGATGHNIDIRGVLVGELIVNNQILEVELLITTKPIRPILGIDFLKKHAVSIDIATDGLILKNPVTKKLEPILEERKDIFQGNPISIRANEQVQIEPQQMHFISGIPDCNIKKNIAYMIEPTPYTRGSIRTIRSITNYFNDILLVGVANFEDEPITIKKGDMMAQIEPI